MKHGTTLLLWVLLLLWGCHPSGEKVAGTYVAPYSNGTDYVVLKADHSYVHFGKQKGVGRKQDGIWRFEQQAGQKKLIMQDWIYYAHPFADPEFLGVKTTSSIYWSKEKLLFQPDFDEYNYYRKSSFN